MRKLATLTILAICMSACRAQVEVQTTSTGLVTIASRGADVRTVLHDLFSQAKKNYVIEPNVHFVLYLNLTTIEFEEALAIVLKQASLSYEVENGIFYIGKAKSELKRPAVKAALELRPAADPLPPKPKGKLPTTALAKKITTRLTKVDLRELMRELTRQTGVAIEVDARVPNYKLDAFLIGTSLKYGLDVICDAAKLTFTLTDNQTIKIAKNQTETNRVTIVDGKPRN